MGNDVAGVRLWFEDGRSSGDEATRGGDFLERMLDMDEGARYLGEVAFGMNDEIQSPTRDTLFDEKIGGTCHVALGMAFPEAAAQHLGPALGHGLRPAPGGEIHGDGEVISRDGRVPVSDPRIQRLADVVVNFSLELGEGDRC